MCRVSRPWVRIPPSPPLTALNQKEDLDSDSLNSHSGFGASLLYEYSMAIPELTQHADKLTIYLLVMSTTKELQKVMILFRLTWLRYSILIIAANLVNSLTSSRKSGTILVK